MRRARSALRIACTIAVAALMRYRSAAGVARYRWMIREPLHGIAIRHAKWRAIGTRHRSNAQVAWRFAGADFSHGLERDPDQPPQRLAQHEAASRQIPKCAQHAEAKSDARRQV